MIDSSFETKSIGSAVAATSSLYLAITAVLGALTAVLIVVAVRADLNIGYQGVLTLFAGMTAMAAFIALQRVLEVSALRQEISSVKDSVPSLVNMTILIRENASSPEFQTQLMELQKIPYSRKRATVEPWEVTVEELVGRDNNLALARLRMDLESELRRIAGESGITVSPRNLGTLSLGRELSDRKVLPEVFVPLLREVVDICNRAVHGEKISTVLTKAVVEAGNALLDALRRLPRQMSQRPTGL